MKKIFLGILITLIFQSSGICQDSLYLYNNKRSPHYYGRYPFAYAINQVDSITLSSGLDSVIIHHDTGKIKFLRNEVDSLTFKKSTPDIDYRTITNFDVLVNAAYSFTRYWYGKEEGMGVSEMGTDIWTPGFEGLIATAGTAQANAFLTNYNNLTKDNVNLRRIWKQFYGGVNACNIGIKIVDDNGYSGSDPRFLRSMELHFLRAFYYWHIAETWGGVHLSTQPFYTVAYKANQSPLAHFLETADNVSVNTFYDQIISDLLLATNYLPSTQAVYGRITKLGAKAFLARVYLTRAHLTNNMSDFTAARDLALEVINTGPYTLLSDYESLWDMNNEINSEIIWAVKYDTVPATSDLFNEISNPFGYGLDLLSPGGYPTTNRGDNNLHPLFIPLYDRAGHDSIYNIGAGGLHIKKHAMVRDLRNGRPFNRFKPSKFLMDLYDETKDRRYQGSFQTVWLRNIYPSFPSAAIAERLKSDANDIEENYIDTALWITKNAPASLDFYTLDVYDTYRPDGTSKNQLNGLGITENNELYPALLKFKDSTRSLSPNDLGDGKMQSGRDVVVVRLAEMYMIAAEAEFKLGNISAAANYINVLRTRSEITPGALTSTTTVELIAGGLDFILDEWAREFAGENRRWLDLKRTGKLISRVQSFNPDISSYIQSYHLVRPIPQVQLDQMIGGSLVQNPGY